MTTVAYGQQQQHQHNENIYNFVQPPEAEEIKPKRYKSKFAEAVRNGFSRGKLSHYTMGEAKTKQPPPEDFLRKGTGQGGTVHPNPELTTTPKPQRAQSARTYREKCDEAKRRPTVPKVTDHVVTPFRSRRNFVHKNALENMISEPVPLQDPHFVDSPHGHIQSLKGAGMIPVYSDKKDFGKIPGYLQKMAKEKDEEQKKWEEEQKEILRKREMMKLQDSDRDSILQGLRTNWSELHHVFQSLSLLTDTLPKRLRKEKIEAQLDELEKFIDLIENHPLIIISDNPYLY